MSKKNEQLNALKAENKKLKSQLEEQKKKLKESSGSSGSAKESSNDEIEKLKDLLTQTKVENQKLTDQNEKAKKIVKAKFMKIHKKSISSAHVIISVSNNPTYFESFYKSCLSHISSTHLNTPTQN